MLSEKDLDRVRAELKEAMTQAAGVERRIARNMSEERVQQGRRRLAQMMGDVGDALRILGSPSNPDEPDEPDNPDNPDVPSIKWPEPGEDNRPVIEDYEVTKGGRVAFKAGYDYVDPKFFALDGMINLDWGNLGVGVRLFNPIYERISDAHILYPNMGHPERFANFASYGGAMIRCAAPSAIEVKGSRFRFVGMKQFDCRFNQFYRGRHGREQEVIDCNTPDEIAMRGWLNFCDGCENASLLAWSGNIDARYSKWKGEKERGLGDYQRTELSYFGRAARIEIGHIGQPQKPALNCVVAEEMRDRTRLSSQKGTQFRTYTLAQFREYVRGREGAALDQGED